MKTKHFLALLVLSASLLFTACGKTTDPAKAKFENDINTFCDNVAEIDAGINNIDSSSEDAPDILLDYLDQLDQQFKLLAELSVPNDYSYMEQLADEASEYMSTAVSSYHEAYANHSFNEYTAEYAKENYDRACKRVTVILELLQGKEITDSDVIIETGNE